jgi:hypothetical protein
LPRRKPPFGTNAILFLAAVKTFKCEHDLPHFLK